MLTKELQGTLPFMSIQLLVAKTMKIEHSEKHDLDLFFWVLLYVCTMFKGPGQRCGHGQWADPEHLFGHWLGKMDNLEEVGGNVAIAYGIGSFWNTVIGCSKGPKALLEQFGQPHFKPLIPMLEALCHEVFLIVKHNKFTTPIRTSMVAHGSYDSVLDILTTALGKLPLHDGPLPPPPSASHNTSILMPPPGHFKTKPVAGGHKS